MSVDVRKQKQNSAMIGDLYFMKNTGVFTSNQKMVLAVESLIDIIFVNLSVLI